jgi:hypothetical protein
MIADLIVVQNDEVVTNQNEAVIITVKRVRLQTLSKKIKRFSKWINPRHWFDSLSDITVTLEEFTCNKNIAEPKD